MSRDRILDAVREGVSPAAAENLAKLKKQALAELAARVVILSGPAIGHSVMAVRTLTALVEDLPRRTASRVVAAMTQAGVRAQRRDPDAETRVRAEDGRSLARARERGQEAGPVAQRRRGTAT